MGWLFGKKKKSKVPFPQPTGETLQFPTSKPKDRVIEPDSVKKAVGFEKPISVPTPQESLPPMPPSKGAPLPPPIPKAPAAPMPARKPVMATPRPMPVSGEGPLYIKKDAYQKILTEIHDLHGFLNKMKSATNILEKSEYNEEAHFERLKKTIKDMHDKLLQTDKVLFKGD